MLTEKEMRKQVIVFLEAGEKIQAVKLFRENAAKRDEDKPTLIVSKKAVYLMAEIMEQKPASILDLITRMECQIESLERQKEAMKRRDNRQCKTIKFCEAESRINLQDMTRRHNRAVDKAAELTQAREKLIQEAEIREDLITDLRERRTLKGQRERNIRIQKRMERMEVEKDAAEADADRLRDRLEDYQTDDKSAEKILDDIHELTHKDLDAGNPQIWTI